MSVIVPLGSYVKFPLPINGLNSSGGSAALGSCTATVSDYTHFFGAQDAYNNFCLVSRSNLPAGVDTPVTVSFNGTDVNGTALPASTADFSFVGPVPPPPAVSINVTTPQVVAKGNGVPSDPGTATVVA